MSHSSPSDPSMPAIAPRSSTVEMIAGRPLIVIDGKPHLPMLHALTDVPGGRWSWEELPQHNIANFAAHGIRLFQLDLFLEHVWPEEEGPLDLTLARRQVAGVLAACPEASVIFRFHLRPPRWWMLRHPEEWVVYADTDYREEQAYGLLRIIEHDNGPVRRVSMASEAWRDAVTAAFERFLEAFAATPEGNALVGIQVANGVYGEWHNWGFFDHEPDVSGPMTAAFRRWLRDKYADESALREAWQQPALTFDTVHAPGMDRRATNGLFRDPVRERDVIDYYECMHKVVADNILHFAAVVKKTWPRPIIAGTFYGYYFSTFGRQAAGGHLQLQRLLEAAEIDYLSGPQAYEPEAIELGDPYRSRSLIASVRLHGKLWLDEMDVEPKIPLLKDADYTRRLQESVADVRRNVAFSYTKGMGLWFYDFNISGVDLDGYTHPMSGSQGNWDHPVVMEQIAALHRLFSARAKQPYESEADVLFVYDTDSFYYTASLVGSDPVSPALIDHLSLAAFRCGVIFDPIHLDDLPRVDLARYRTVVFGNTFLLRDEERRFIREEVAREGRHLIWFHAPGYLDETTGKGGREWVEETTGFRLQEVSFDEPPAVFMRGADGTERSWTLSAQPIHPLFAVADPAAEPRGRFLPDRGVAIARKAQAGHTAWFVSLPSRQIEPLRSILAETEAHCFGPADAFFYGGGGILAMHTLTGGRREVTLRNGKGVVLDLPEGPATVLLDSQTGEVLLNEYNQTPSGLTLPYPHPRG
ncbi:MAG: hypothetical protein ACLFU2_06220 [Opitutales bacterium]